MNDNGGGHNIAARLVAPARRMGRVFSEGYCINRVWHWQSPARPEVELLHTSTNVWLLSSGQNKRPLIGKRDQRSFRKETRCVYRIEHSCYSVKQPPGERQEVERRPARAWGHLGGIRLNGNVTFDD